MVVKGTYVNYQGKSEIEKVANHELAFMNLRKSVKSLFDTSLLEYYFDNGLLTPHQEKLFIELL